MDHDEEVGRTVTRGEAAMAGSGGRIRMGRAALCAAVAATALTIGLIPLPARADDPVPVRAGAFTLDGAGYGHGIGMSQYGAYGAATQGRTYSQILSFYYPGTTLGTRSTTELIRVWLEGDADRDLRVRPSRGLAVSDDLGRSYTVPVGSAYREWRAVRSVDGYFKLQYLSSSGNWVTKGHPLSASAQRTWRFGNTAKLLTVRLTDGSYRELRGSVATFFYGSGTRTVNRLRVETYLRSVVPSEMPTSWSAHAVRAQAVAARTYAARLKSAAPTGASWDICDSVSCQVYRGHATTVGGTRTVHETSNGDAAVAATAGRIVTYQGTIALTQFSSSNGGHSAPGAFPYLKPQPDPYDAVVRPNSWTVTLTAAAVGRAYPTVGAVEQLQVLSRDGYGLFGGRVLSIRVTGSTGSVTVSGPDFRFALTLRSALFTVR
jgi:SpoIID/LytB domain protein